MMRAAVLEDLERLVVKQVPDPAIGPGEILVRVRACAVCGSDVRIYHHGNPRVKPPQILGHEIAGDVVAVGAGVDKFKVGDRVATAADVPCGVCDYCRAGMGNDCAINYALGYQFQGGFAELLALDRRRRTARITVSYGPVHHIPGGRGKACLAPTRRRPSPSPWPGATFIRSRLPRALMERAPAASSAASWRPATACSSSARARRGYCWSRRRRPWARPRMYGQGMPCPYPPLRARAAGWSWRASFAPTR